MRPGNRTRTLSSSASIEVQGAVLSEIKLQDDATWKDMGRVLGKSEDRAAVYASGVSPIDLPTFLFACREWGGRFADPLLALAGGKWADAGAYCTSDEKAALTLASLLPAIIEVEADSVTEARELLPHETLIRRVHTLTAMWLEMIASERGVA